MADYYVQLKDGQDNVYPEDRTVKVSQSGNTGITTSAGSLSGTSDFYLEYDKDKVFFNCRILLQNIPGNTRPTVTIKNDAFVNCPSFIARGNPCLRGSAGSPSVSDECYAYHTVGYDYIKLYENNFIGTAPAGYLVMQIPGTTAL